MVSIEFISSLTISRLRMERGARSSMSTKMSLILSIGQCGVPGRWDVILEPSLSAAANGLRLDSVARADAALS